MKISIFVVLRNNLPDTRVQRSYVGTGISQKDAEQLIKDDIEQYEQLYKADDYEVIKDTIYP
jgi:hypothetical protein